MKYRRYEEHLDDALKDPEEAANYLNAVLEDGDMDALLIALADVARAHGVTAVAKRSGLQRVGSYKMLRRKANPELLSIMKVLRASGLQMAVKAA